MVLYFTSDSQGTTSDTKKSIDKIFQINKSVGLVGAHSDAWTNLVVNHLKNMPEKYENEQKLTDYLHKHFCELHKEQNKPEPVVINMDLINSLNFRPEIFISTKLKDDEFYIHHIGFRSVYETLIRDIPTIDQIYEYEAMGSGSPRAISSMEDVKNRLKKSNNKISELPIEINIGIAMHAISKAIESDLFSGGDIQIGIADKKGFRKISIDEQLAFYYKAIKDLETLFGEDETEIKKLLPVKIIKLL